jgi:hypothetical protein
MNHKARDPEDCLCAAAHARVTPAAVRTRRSRLALDTHQASRSDAPLLLDLRNVMTTVCSLRSLRVLQEPPTDTLSPRLVPAAGAACAGAPAQHAACHMHAA